MLDVSMLSVVVRRHVVADFVDEGESGVLGRSQTDSLKELESQLLLPQECRKLVPPPDNLDKRENTNEFLVNFNICKILFL